MKTRICHFSLTQFGLLLIASSQLLIASCSGSQGKQLISKDVPISGRMFRRKENRKITWLRW